MRYNVTCQTGIESYDSIELEATSYSEAWIKGARLLKSPIVMRVAEVA
jgi:hypothetical protein